MQTARGTATTLRVRVTIASFVNGLCCIWGWDPVEREVLRQRRIRLYSHGSRRLDGPTVEK